MKRLRLKRDYKAVAETLKKKAASADHADEPINEDTVVITPDGRIVAVYLKEKIPPALIRRAFRRWRKLKDVPENRAVALGSVRLPGIRKDGTLSGRLKVPNSTVEVVKKQGTRHGILGYKRTAPGQQYRKTPLTKRHPRMLTRNKSLVKLVDKLYTKYLPSIHAIQKAELDKAPNCRLWHTAFSTIYLAKKFPTKYHRDGWNLKGVMTALMTMAHSRAGF
jgi:hypothetical protein